MLQPRRRAARRALFTGCFTLGNARTAIVVAGAVLMLLLNFSRRESPYYRRLRMLAAEEHRRQTQGLGNGGSGAQSARGLVSGGESSSVGGTESRGTAGATGAGGATGKADVTSRGILEGASDAGASSEGGGTKAASGHGLPSTGLSPRLSAGVGTVRLSNGVLMPRLGLGTAGLGQHTEDAVLWAIEEGYRLIDSAQAREWYREDLVGRAIRRANVSRDKLFIVSKLHPRHMGYRITLERFEDSLRDLGLQYVDLFLLHYPWCFPAICGTAQPEGAWHDSWRAFEELYNRGKARAIGVSNFGEAELKELLRQADVKPHALQRNSDPLRADFAMQKLCRENNVAYMAYSSLGTQWQLVDSKAGKNPVLNHPSILDVASRRGCSASQVVLKWGLMKGQIVIPRSGNRLHLRENFQAIACNLLAKDINAIDGLDGSYDGM